MLDIFVQIKRQLDIIRMNFPLFHNYIVPNTERNLVAYGDTQM